MKMLVISKALPAGSQVIEDYTIVLTDKPPSFSSLADLAKFFDNDAEDLAEVLEHTLPGGTFDRLVAKLLMHKAGHFMIPWGGNRPVGKDSKIARTGHSSDQ